MTKLQSPVYRIIPLLLAFLFMLSGSALAADPITDISKVAAGGEYLLGSHSCALTTSGGVLCWGDNESGQVGNGNTTTQARPIAVTGLSGGVTQVVTGGAHSCALTSSGGVKCWGLNTYGQLGDNSTTNRNTPVDVSSLSSGVTKLTAGRHHTCAITDTGAVKCWGLNSTWQLGAVSDEICSSEDCEKTPIEAISSGIAEISAGWYHTCAVTTGGAAKCWGNNYYGQLGNNSTIDSLSAVQVEDLTSGVSKIAIGNASSCALLSTGEVMCWGSNLALELGFTSVTSCSGVPCSKVPGNVLTSAGAVFFGAVNIAGGANFYCVLTSSTGVKCWGDSSSGQLGATAPDNCTGQPCSDAPLDVTGLTSGVTQVSCGNAHACAVTDQEQLKCWGLGTQNPAFILEPYEYFSLTGNITLNSAPFSGVTVNGGALGNRTTDANGDFSYLNVQEDTNYALAPSKSGYCFTPGSVGSTLVANTSENFTAFLCYSITGVVSGNGSPISNVTINGGPLGSQTTDASGNYDFQGVAAGTSYTLTPSKAGFTFSPASTSGTLNGNITRSFTATHTISGHVTTSGGSPVAGVSVGSQITDANGFYQITNHEHGTSYNLTPTKSGYTFSPANATGTLNSNLTQNFTATQIVYTISGHLLTGSSGPIANTTVNGGALGNKTTNSSGFYSFTNVPAGTSYTITPSSNFYAFNPVSRSGTLNGNTTANFTGTEVYTLSGTITSGGAGLSGVTVNGGVLGNATTNAQGVYTFNGLTYGTSFSLTPQKAGYKFSPVTSSGVIFGYTTRDFIATALHQLSGTVTIGGAPASGVTINGGALGTTTTDQNGQYIFNDVSHGTSYTLTPSKENATFSPESAGGTLNQDALVNFSGSTIEPTPTPSPTPTETSSPTPIPPDNTPTPTPTATPPEPPKTVDEAKDLLSDAKDLLNGINDNPQDNAETAKAIKDILGIVLQGSGLSAKDKGGVKKLLKKVTSFEKLVKTENPSPTTWKKIGSLKKQISKQILSTLKKMK